MCGDFPPGIRNKLKAKLAELAAASNQVTSTEFVIKECWVFHEADYADVRSMEGNEALADLPATSQDAVNAKKIALRLGIPEQNIKFFTRQSAEDIN